MGVISCPVFKIKPVRAFFVIGEKLNFRCLLIIMPTMSMKSTTKSVCNVCAEVYNKSNRTLVRCICGYECCKECVKMYLLGRSEDAACMSCKVGWDRKFLMENMDKLFMMKRYKEFREELLVEREMGMLQATQPYVEREIRMEVLSEEIKELRNEYFNKMGELEREMHMLKNNGEESRKKFVREFVRKCPNGECHGFLSSALKCELCGCWACGECREIKGFTSDEKDVHVCNKEILESVKLLERDSKPCPKCSSLIFKINGCDQMYCVECHTAFSWRTLKIESGVVHNPHYFEYQRRRNNGVVPRNPLDVRCGRELDNYFVTRLMERRNARYKSKDDMTNICRMVIHIRYVEQARFNVNDRLMNNLKLRIDYMRNKMSRDDMKKLLQKREKDNMKKGEINNILGMYVSCMTDLFYRLMNNEDEERIKNEMNELRVYTNECLSNVSKVYNCKKYNIDKSYKFV